MPLCFRRQESPIYGMVDIVEGMLVINYVTPPLSLIGFVMPLDCRGWRYNSNHTPSWLSYTIPVLISIVELPE